MIDIKLLLSDLENIKAKTLARKSDINLDGIIEINDKRKAVITETEELKSKKNKLSAEIGKLIKSGVDITELSSEVKKLSSNIDELDGSLKLIQTELDNIILTIPNIIDNTTPIGSDEKDNIVVRKVGEPRKFDFEIKPHWDIGTDLAMIDFERGAKIAKSRFTVLYSDIARLDRAIASFMLDTHRTAGYIEVATPFLVNEKSMIGTGQLPKFKDDAFYCNEDNLYLIPTAEVPVTNLYADEIIDSAKLPIKHSAYSACFRREAGSYGKDVRGLIRQHQFNKVELVKIVDEANSMLELESMVQDAERILQLLKLPYRTISLCSGDIGFSSSKTYDIEVWIPSQNIYREISSCSNCKDFQARRANIRYRDKDGKTRFAHTLNGSGLAVGRTLVAILENYQNADGSVTIPEVLRSYLANQDIIKVLNR